MVEVKVLEFGYSLENGNHFIRFDIKGMEEEKKDKMLPMIVNIPLGNIKRFVIESDTDESLKLLEYFPEKEYPFNKEVPDENELKSVEEMVKGFLNR